MPIKVTCTQCGGVLHAPDDSAGKRGRCPTCGTVLTIVGETVSASPSQFGAPPAVATTPRPMPPGSNPWGSLPGGSGDRPAAPAPYQVPLGPPVGERPTYDLAKESGAPRPMPIPQPSEAVPPSHGSRVPPDPRKNPVQDPFAKPGKRTDEQEVVNRGWRKVRRGLGWVRAGVFFLLLGVLAYAAVPILQTLSIPLPNQTPGFLQIDGYSQSDEIRLLGTVGPLALGLLLCMFGRMGVSAAPATSYARSPAMFSSLATVAAVGGFLAFAVITGLAMKDSKLVPQFTPDWGKPKPTATLPEKATAWAEGMFLAVEREDITPPVQGLGLGSFVVFGLLAEVWFVAALGRMAAALHHAPAAGRVNRFVVLVGTLFAIKMILLLAARVYFKDWVQANVWAKWALVEEKWQTVALMGGLAFGGLVLAVLYWRMIGGVRRAILDGVDPAP